MFSACIHLGSLSVSLQVLLTHHKEVVKIHLHFVCHLPVTSLEAFFLENGQCVLEAGLCFLEM